MTAHRPVHVERTTLTGATLAVAAVFAIVDLVAGLLLPGGYVLRLAWLHVLVVVAAALAAAVAAVATWTRRPEASAWALAAAGALAGTELPWSTEGLLARPWFSWCGIAAGAIVAALLLRTIGAPLGRSVALWRAAGRERRATRDRAAAARNVKAGRGTVRPAAAHATAARATAPRAASTRATAQAVAPGWYADPAGSGLRWWDGASWTAHQARHRT